MCPLCKQDLPLHNGLCGQCNARQLDRLKSALQHVIQNWRDGSNELDDVMQPSLVVAKGTLSECADFLDKILKACCEKS